MRLLRVFVVCLSMLASAEATEAATPDVCGVSAADRSFWRNTEQAARRRIEDQASFLRTASANIALTASSRATVHAAADCLGRHYGELSGQQQGAVNTGSQVVAVSGGGALLSAANATALGYAAFTPILFNQVSALEPKRNLFAATQIGIGRIAERHAAIWQAGAMVESGHSRAGGLDTLCDAQVAGVFSTAPAIADASQRALIVAEVQRLQTQCTRLRRQDAELALLREDFGALKDQLPRRHAAEVLDFHDSVTQRHRELLFTPTETLAAILASPFRAADQLLTGSGGQKALEQVQTQQALEGVNQSLYPFARFLTAPSADSIPTPRSAEAFRSLNGGGDVNRAVSSLQGIASRLDGIEAGQRRDLHYAKELIDAAQRTELKFAYSSTGNTLTITLEKPVQTPAINPAAAR